MKALQARESAAWTRLLSLSDAIPSTADWRIEGSRYLDSINFWFQSFWPRGMTEQDKSQANEMFDRFAFPIWRPIWNKYDAAAALGPGEAGYISEVACVHECDAAIMRRPYAYPPISSSGRNSEMDRLKTHKPQDLYDGNRGDYE